MKYSMNKNFGISSQCEVCVLVVVIPVMYVQCMVIVRVKDKEYEQNKSGLMYFLLLPSLLLFSILLKCFFLYACIVKNVS